MCLAYTTYFVLVTQLCPILWDPMDCSPPGSPVHEILQARILEWVAISSSGDLSDPGTKLTVSYVSCIGRLILYHCSTWEALPRKVPYKW